MFTPEPEGKSWGRDLEVRRAKAVAEELKKEKNEKT